MRARMASEQKLTDSGILEAKQGKVRLIHRKELGKSQLGYSRKEIENSTDKELSPNILNPNILNPNSIPIWAIVQHLCRALDEAGGLERCAELMAKLSADTVERVKALAYRVYQICDRKGWTEEALAYNNLVAMWGILEGKTKEARKRAPEQGELGL
jgi:putative DNA methylase